MSASLSGLDGICDASSCHPLIVGTVILLIEGLENEEAAEEDGGERCCEMMEKIRFAGFAPQEFRFSESTGCQRPLKIGL